MSVQTVAGKFIELVNQGKDFEVMRTMYAPDIISVEADGREINGQQPVIRHSEVWQGRNTIHSGQLRGPYFNGPDQFAVHFTIDVTRTDSGTREAIEEVLHAPARADTLWLGNGKLSITRPTGDDAKKAQRVYLGYDAADKPTGYALQVVEPGFADPITLLIGYNASRRELLGMKVLESKETPGIADKIVLPSFTTQFRGRVSPLTGIKRDESAKMASDRSAVVMITGATISSRAVVRGINRTIAHWQPYLDAYGPAGGTSHDTLGAGGKR